VTHFAVRLKLKQADKTPSKHKEFLTHNLVLNISRPQFNNPGSKENQ